MRRKRETATKIVNLLTSFTLILSMTPMQGLAKTENANSTAIVSGQDGTGSAKNKQLAEPTNDSSFKSDNLTNAEKSDEHDSKTNTETTNTVDVKLNDKTSAKADAELNDQQNTGLDSNVNATKDKSGDNTNADSVDVMEDKSDEGTESQSAQKALSFSAEDYSITLTYDSSANIPENASLSAFEVTRKNEYDSYLKDANALLMKDGEIAKEARFFDIKIEADDAEIQPQASVRVDIVFASDDDSHQNAKEAAVLHFAEDQPQMGVSAVETGSKIAPTSEIANMDNGKDADIVTFTADSFSVYGVVYTVDFHWGEYTYNLAGGSNIRLSELLGAIGTSVVKDLPDDSIQLLVLSDDMSQIVDVAFSTPELLKIEKQGGDDWLLTPLVPFDSEEELTLTLVNGIQIVIKVTDENEDAVARVSNDGGTNWSYHATLAEALNYAAGLTSGSVIIETLKETDNSYTLTSGFTFNDTDIADLTFRTTTDAGFRSTLVQGSEIAESMITVGNGKPLTVENLIFHGNGTTSVDSGAAINYASGESLTLSHVDFGALNDDAIGKAIEELSSEDVNYSKEFSVNVEGAAVECSNTLNALSVSDCAFYGGKTTTGYGSAINIISQTTPNLVTSISDTAFIGCVAGQYAAYNETWIQNSTATSRSLTLENCVFTDCIGKSSAGGAFVSRAVDSNIANSTFTRCDCTGSGNGGAGYIANGKNIAGTATVEACTFTGCNVTNGDGGGLYIGSSNTSIVVTDSTFDTCVANNGSGVNIQSGNTTRTVTFERCDFSGCNSKNGYGAICENAGSDSVCAAKTIVRECSFADCKSTDWAGALILRSPQVVMEDCDIFRCSGSISGSEGNSSCAVYISSYNSSGSVNVVRCHFDNGGKGKKDGGALHLNREVATLNIEGCKFENSKTSAKGGAVYAYARNTEIGKSTVPEDHLPTSGTAKGLEPGTEIVSSFTGCTAVGSGGAVYANSALNISDTSFTDCIATGSGGAVYANSALNISDTSFTDCIATGSGGAVYASSTCTINNNGDGTVIFSDNSANVEGGAIHVYGGSMIINNTAGGTIGFENCSAATSDGGAISTNSRPITVNNSGTVRFEDCTGNTGGAICSHQDSSVTVNNAAGAVFECINCTGVERAGAVWTGDFTAQNNKGTIRFDTCVANGMSADNANSGAGAVYVGKSFVLTNIDNGMAEFVNCSATKTQANGGAILLYNKNRGTGVITISGTAENPVSFTNCSASNGNGGAIYQTAGQQISLSNVIMSGNSASRGGAVYSTSKDIRLSNTVSITNNTLTSTDIKGGGGIYLQDDESIITIESEGDTADITVNNNKTSDEGKSNIFTGRMAPAFEIKNNLNGVIGVVNAASSGYWFGHGATANICGDDEALSGVFLDDTGNYTARYRGNGINLYWTKDGESPICKLTDEDGKLITYNEEDAVFYDLSEAFGVFDDYTSHPELFNVAPRNIEMLVDAHTQSSILRVPGTLTLKTASDFPVDGKYPGPVSRCTITRGDFVDSMFIMDGTDNFTIEDIIIDGNDTLSDHNGGIVRASGTGMLNIGKAELKNGKTSQYGGAIHLDDGVGIAMSENAEIRTCSSAISGGGIYLAGKRGVSEISNSTFTGCTLTNTDTSNNANGSGGAIYSDGRTLNVSGSTFSSCKASKRGGAIGYYGESATTLTVNGSSFIGCETTLNTTAANTCFGGGIFVNNGRLVIGKNEDVRTRFENCRVNRYGGAIMLYGSGEQIIDHADFINCGCNVYNGGAYYTESSNSLRFYDCTFTNCAAGSSNGSGGAIYEYNTSENGFTVEACTFQTCKAEAGNGGAIYSKRSVSVKDSDINNGCSAKNGAALYTEGKSITVDGGTITSNIATTGGAIGASSSDSRLNFKGGAVVSGNTRNGNASNVYMDFDTDALIQADDLTEDANIGVYVGDNYLGRYGKAGRTFAHYIGEANNLDRFVNDRELSDNDDELRGVAFSGNRIAWPGMPLKMTVLDADDNPVEGARFTIDRVDWDDQPMRIFSGETGEDGKVIIPWQTEGNLPGAEPVISDDGGSCAFELGYGYIMHETDTKQGYSLPGGYWNIVVDGIAGVTPVAKQIPGENQTPEIEKESLFDWKTVNQKDLMITYDLQGGTWAEQPEQVEPAEGGLYTQDVAYGEALSFIPDSAPGKEGFRFVEWNSDAYGTGDISYQPGDKITGSSGTTITLYAIWVKAEYVARVIDNNGTITYHEALVDGTNVTYNGKTIKKGAFTYANTLTGNVAVELIKTAPGTGRTQEEESSYYNLGSGSSVGFTFNKSGLNLTIRTMPGLGFASTICKNTTNSLFSVANLSSLKIENLIFDGNSSNKTGTTDGGIFNISNAYASFTDVVFKQCSVNNKNGGAVNYNNSSGKLEIYGCKFDNCKTVGTATSYNIGAAVHFYNGSSLLIDRSDKNRTQFVDCVANRWGGGFYSEPDNGVVTVRHADFIRCQANPNNQGGHGGGFGTDSANLTVVDCYFDNCTCTKGKGGGFYQARDNSSITVRLSQCRFSECQGTDGGGAYISNKKLSITNGIFSQCSTAGNGGGVYAEGTITTDGVINGAVKFESCSATGNGGGVYVAGGLNKIFKAEFTDNYATNGGSVYIKGKSSEQAMEMRDCSFDGHVNLESEKLNATTNGGAIYIGEGCYQIYDCTFKDATAGNDGGLVWASPGDGDKVDIQRCAFFGHDSLDSNIKNAKNGGGLLIRVATGSVKDTTFEDCSADNGGGMYAYTATTAENATFDDCRANNNGGAIYFVSGGTLSNVSIDGHEDLASDMPNAELGGALWLANNCTLNIIGGNIIHCSASTETGGAINVGGTASVLNFAGSSIVYNNPSNEDGVQQKNVVLDQNSNTVIKTAASGLNQDSQIGIYVSDGQSVSHGVSNMPFGTWNTSNNNLERLINDRDNALYGITHSNTDSKIYWGRIICKVVDNDNQEHPFTTLGAAVQYVRSNLGGVGTVQMLCDYTMLEFDKVILNDVSDDITFTTAHTVETKEDWEQYVFEDTLANKTDAGTAVLTRGWDGGSTSDKALFYVSNSSAKLTTRNIIFDGKELDVQHSGRAIYVNSGLTYIERGSIFQNFISPGSGGAMFVNGSLSVEGTAAHPIRFVNCQATAGSGGAIYHNSSNLKLSHVTFGVEGDASKACKATAQGGALYTASQTRAEISDCNFYESVATTGAAVRLSGSAPATFEITFSRCLFAGTKANDFGAIFAGTDSGQASNSKKNTFNECSFKNCMGRNYGSAIVLRSNDVEINACAFENCYVTTSNSPEGGAIYMDAHNDVNIVSSHFKNCYGNGGLGGALYLKTKAKSLSVSSSNFENCGGTENGRKNSNGGAIYANATSTSIDNTSFANCTGTQNGGGIYATDVLNLIDGDFSECSAINGGAIYALKTCSMNGTQIINCHANSNGGGIYFNDSSTHRMENCTLSGCSADSMGGAVFLENNKALTISDGKISGCSASDANGGAVNVGGSGAKLYFEGDASIYANPTGGKDQRNVVLNQNNTTTINTTDTGLGNDAMVGIYVTDGCFAARGEKYKDFGSHGSSIENLDCFVNDRNALIGGEGSDPSKLLAWTSGYKLVLDPNGGEGTLVSAVLSYFKEYALGQPYTKEGWHFAGWNTRKDGTGDAYSASDIVSRLTDEDGATVTLYAQWEEWEPCTITFHPNGGTEVASRELKPGTLLGYLPSSTREHYAFMGWKWIENGEEKSYSQDTVVEHDMDFYATWQKKVKITFDPDGGIVGEPVREILPGKIGSLPRAEQPVAFKLDYEFDCWKDPSGNIVNANTVFTEDTTLTAQWKVIKRRLAFDSNYRSSSNGGLTSQYLYVDEPLNNIETIRNYEIHAFPAIENLNHGYRLVGWFTEKEGGEQKQIGDILDLRDTRILHAHWEQALANVTVTFDSDGGSNCAAITVFEGDEIENYPEPKRQEETIDGTTYVYSFAGWYLLDQNGDFAEDEYGAAIEVNNRTVIDENIVVKAKWDQAEKIVPEPDPEPVYHTITFNGNYTNTSGNTPTSSKRVQEGRPIRDIPGMTRNGYVLEGWYPAADGTGEELFSTKTFDADTTYYAKWRVATDAEQEGGYRYDCTIIWSNENTSSLTNVDDRLTWHVLGSTGGNAIATALVRFRNYPQQGSNIPVGTVHIKIPKYVFEDWNGNKITGTNDIVNKVPKAPNTRPGYDWNYTQDETGDYYILSNAVVLQGNELELRITYTAPMSQVKACRLEASTGKVIDDKGQYIEDTYSPRDNVFTVTIDQGDGEPLVHERHLQTAAYKDYTFTYNADYQAGDATPNSSPYAYSSWNSSWGQAPDDADDYYYIQWTHGSFRGNAVNNGMFQLDEKTWLPDAHEVALRADGTPVSTDEYIITRHKYSDLVNGKATHYKKEIVRGTWTNSGEEKIGTATIKQDVEFYSMITEASTPGGERVQPWDQYKYNGWNVSTGQEVLLDDEKISSSFSMYMKGPGNEGNLEPVGDSSLYHAKEYTMIMRDGNRGDITYSSSKLGSKNIILGENDYAFTQARISLSNWDGYRDESLWHSSSNTSYSSWKPVEVWVRDRGASQFYKYADVYIDSSSSKSISLPANTVAVEIRHNTVYWRTDLSVNLSLDINPTSHVKELVEQDYTSKINSTFKNTAHVEAISADSGETLYSATTRTGSFDVGKGKTRLVASKSAGSAVDNVNEGIQSVPITVTGKNQNNTNRLRPIYSGIFYELLPKDALMEESSVYVDAGSDATRLNRSMVNVSFENNWKDTGRTMMIVSFNVPDSIRSNTVQMHYTLKNTYANLLARGNSMYGQSAFVNTTMVKEPYEWNPNSERKVSKLNVLQDSYVFQDLENEYGDYVAYAQATARFNSINTFSYGFTKLVNTRGIFEENTSVLTGNEYSYRLSYAQSTGKEADSLSFFDFLEIGSDTKESKWQGTLLDVDISEARSVKDENGVACAPVVYYSTKDRTAFTEEDYDLNSEGVWTTEKPEEGITAIAVDCTKNVNGESFVLKDNSSLFVIIKMKAPSDERLEGLESVNQARAYARDLSSDLDVVPTDGGTTVTMKIPAPEINLNSEPESGTSEEPALVAYKDTVTYDIAVTNPETEGTGYVYNDVIVEDSLPEGVTPDWNDIRVYTNDPANSEKFTIRKDADPDDPDKTVRIGNSTRASLLVKDGKFTFSVHELLDGETLHISIPTIVDIRRGLFSNQAVLAGVNGLMKNMRTDETYHEVRLYDVNLNKKTLETQEFLPGAHLVIYDSSGEITLAYNESTESFFNADWVTDGTSHTMKLGAGEYTLIESEAPDNYALSEPVRFSLSRDGVLTMPKHEDSIQTIDMYDKYIAVDTIVSNDVVLMGEAVNPEPNKEFSYIATLTGLKPNSSYRLGTGEDEQFVETQTFNALYDGSANVSFKLKDGESLTFAKLPTGAHMTVTQTGTELFQTHYEAVVRNGTDATVIHRAETNVANQDLTTKETAINIDQGVVRFEFKNVLEEGVPVRFIVIDESDSSNVVGAQMHIQGPEVPEGQERFTREWESFDDAKLIKLPKQSNYILRQLQVPEQYIQMIEPVILSMDDNGVLTCETEGIVSSDENGYIVTIRIPRKTKVTVLNLGEDTQWLLSGATFKLVEGDDGTPMREWVSGSAAGEVLYLERNTTYTVEKTGSPSDYQPIEPSKVSLTVGNDGSVTATPAVSFDTDDDNVLTFMDRFIGKVEISNLVQGYKADVNRDFVFTLTVPNAQPDKTYAWVKYGSDGMLLSRSDEGDAAPLSSGDSFSLKHGERILIDLPVGELVSISEEPCSYNMTVDESRANGVSNLEKLSAEDDYDAKRIRVNGSTFEFLRSGPAKIQVINDTGLVPLTIEKSVADYRMGQPDTYIFRLNSVEDADDEGYSWIKYGNDGSVLASDGSDGQSTMAVGDTFDLRDGQSIVIDLPLNKAISVSEDGKSIMQAEMTFNEDAGESSDVQGEPGSQEGGSTGSGGEEGEVDFSLDGHDMLFSLTKESKISVTNRFTTVPLTLSKQIEGAAANSEDSFFFTLDVADDGTYSWNKVKADGTVESSENDGLSPLIGTSTFELDAGERITIDLPYDKAISLTEEAPEGYQMSVEEAIEEDMQSGLAKLNPSDADDAPRIDVNGQTMEFTLEAGANIVVTNTKQPMDFPLVITNTVQGSMGNKKKEFSFIVSGFVPNANIQWTKYEFGATGEYQQVGQDTFVADDEGNLGFQLKHDQKIELTITSGTSVTVSEICDSYTPEVETVLTQEPSIQVPTTISKTDSVINASLEIGADTTLNVTNTLDDISLTGRTLPAPIYPALLLLGLGAVIIVLASRLRRESR